MGTRVKQALIVAFGTIVALVMVLLGLWQMQVFVDEGDRSVQARAEQPPVPLFDYVNPDGTVGDIYGRPVTLTGRYLPDQQVIVPAEDGTLRVLTAFQVADGRVVPVVRGATKDRALARPAPTGSRTETGLFLPGEGDDARPVGPGELSSVRTPLLAQRWPQRLAPGFVTLGESGSAAHGLSRAGLTLPHGDGSFQNGGYALQWWIFAAFGLGMSLKLAQSLGQRDRTARETAAQAELDAAARAEHAEPSLTATSSSVSPDSPTIRPG